MLNNIARGTTPEVLVTFTVNGQHQRVVNLLGDYRVGLYCYNPETETYEIGTVEFDARRFDASDTLQQYRDMFHTDLETQTGLVFLRAGMMVIQDTWERCIKSIEIDGKLVATYNAATHVLTPELKVPHESA